MRKSQKKQSPELQNGEKQDKEQQQSSLQKEEEKDDELSLFSEQDLLEIFSHESKFNVYVYYVFFLS